MQTISQNKITQEKHGQFNAVDIGRYDTNGLVTDTDYYAPEDGVITAWGDSGTCGLRLVLEGANGRHGFCHNESSYVKVGDRVKRGQKLGKMGYTGLTVPDDVPAGTHVHWVILKNGVYLYPINLVNESFIKNQGGDEMTQSEAEKVVTYFYLLGTGDYPDPGQSGYWVPRVKDVPTGIDELGKELLKTDTTNKVVNQDQANLIWLAIHKLDPAGAAGVIGMPWTDALTLVVNGDTWKEQDAILANPSGTVLKPGNYRVN